MISYEELVDKYPELYEYVESMGYSEDLIYAYLKAEDDLKNLEEEDFRASEAPY